MNKLLTNFPVTLTEEQKNVLKLTLSAVLQDDPITKYWRPTVYENGDIMWALVASESVPLSQNIKGPSGFTPQFQIDQSTAEWEVTYDGTNWTPLGIIASGAQGPQGIPGKDGADGTDGKDGTNGTSVYLDNVSTVAGGTQVTLGWGTSDTSAFVIPSGAAGANGVSPTVELTEIHDPDYPQGGWNVTITDAEHQSGQTFQIFNGIDGQGATVDLVEGNGIQITHQAGTTDYTIGVSADYALKSYANDASANALSAAETWVNQQNFATSAGLDANKQYAMTTNGWADFVVPSTSGYLPLSGGTVSDQLVVSGGSTFDQQFLKIIREGVNGYGRMGLGQYGSLALKVDDANSHTTQVNISPNTTNDQLIQVQHNGSEAGYLIPAKIHQGSYTPTSADGILHIILES